MVRFTKADRDELRRAAKRDGLKFSEWCRLKLAERADLLVPAVATPDPVLPPKPRGSAYFQLGDKAEFVIRKELTPEEAKSFVAVAEMSAEGMIQKQAP